MLKDILIKIWKFILIIIVTIRNIFRKNRNISKSDTKTIKVNKDSIKKTSSITSNIDEEPSTISIPYQLRINDLDIEVKDLINNNNLNKEDKIKIIKQLEKKIAELKLDGNNLIAESPKATKERDNNIILIKRNEEILKQYASKNDIIINKGEDNNDKTDKDNVINIDIIERDAKKDYYINYIKQTNKYLKEVKNELNDIESTDINSTKMDNYKYKVEDIKNKIKDIQKQYYDFKHSNVYNLIKDDYDLNELDKFEIIKSDENINLYINKCNTILTKINTYKEYKNTTKQDISNEPKKEEKEVVNQKEENKTKPLIEIENAALMVSRDVEKQKNMVEKLQIRINSYPVYERKVKRLNFFDNLLSNTLKLSISLLPLRIFKSKPLGMLVSGFMLNNSIRSMRKIMVTESPCEYIEFNRLIKTQIDVVNNYKTICIDSLYQINALKEEFKRVYGNNIKDDDISKVYNKLLTLENQVEMQVDNLNDSKTKLNSKIKKIGTMYRK